MTWRNMKIIKKIHRCGIYTLVFTIWKVNWNNNNKKSIVIMQKIINMDEEKKTSIFYYINEWSMTRNSCRESVCTIQMNHNMKLLWKFMLNSVMQKYLSIVLFSANWWCFCVLLSSLIFYNLVNKLEPY